VTRPNPAALIGAVLLSLSVLSAAAEPAGGLSMAHHRVVYQLNQGDPEYMQQVLNSAGALLRLHGDDIRIVITAFGPGLQLLVRQPRQPLPKALQQRVAGLAQYGVEFHACGNTLQALGLTGQDLLPEAERVEAGADDLMQLQQQGYAYIRW
jgi:intracellular sulfur oxidation DsrE/DsrF family protein